ncbi:MAG: hypothetical protein IKE30_07540 [Clostridia bacterium]|nr:hypothetical protein [Clostridia bacterium]
MLKRRAAISAAALFGTMVLTLAVIAGSRGLAARAGESLQPQAAESFAADETDIAGFRTIGRNGKHRGFNRAYGAEQEPFEDGSQFAWQAGDADENWEGFLMDDSDWLYDEDRQYREDDFGTGDDEADSDNPSSEFDPFDDESTPEWPSEDGSFDWEIPESSGITFAQV